jgi:hypothetical protein
MRVLILESHPGVASDAVGELRAAGHTIARCDSADHRFPCRGLSAGGECPLDEHVDVAVLVQELGTHHVEHGAICAARSRVPVLRVDPADVGRPSLNTWTTAAGPDLLSECERAARDGGAHVRAVAERLTGLGVLEESDLGHGGTVVIDVTREADRLRMTIDLAGAALDREAEIVRAASLALRDFDGRPAVIDVVVRPMR